MTEEELKKVETGEAVDNTDYIAAIKELKENSVDRSKYDQLKAEHKKMLDAFVNGRDVDLPQPEAKTNDELRKELFNKDSGLSNIEFVRDMLELRNNLLAEGEPDPFLPHGRKISPSDSDIAAANKVATVLQECLDYADDFDGDNEVFTNELQRRMVDAR